MIGRDHELSVDRRHQACEAVGIAGSTVYYPPRPVPADDLFLMREIDKLHTEFRGIADVARGKSGRTQYIHFNRAINEICLAYVKSLMLDALVAFNRRLIGNLTLSCSVVLGLSRQGRREHFMSPCPDER